MASKSKRLLLAAGGTGGHMFPAQALAEEMIKAGWEAALITDARGEKLAGNFPSGPQLTIAAASINPKRPLASVKGVLTILKGMRQSKAFIKDWQPDVVAGFGGYPAFPAVKAAQGLGIPTLLHEQNAVLGRVNRALSKGANVLACGFDRIEKCAVPEKLIVTGNPLRSQIMESVPKAYRSPTKTINVLIVGGSLGAKLISETMPKALALLPDALRARLSVVQQTRKESLETAQQVYSAAGITAHCETFFHNIETELAKAHYVIGRAGASSVSEIAVMGKPSLFVPLGIAMDDHQTMNAQSLKDLDAADILPELEFTPEKIAHILELRLNDSHWLKQAATAARNSAKADAAAHLARLVKELAKKQ